MFYVVVLECVFVSRTGSEESESEIIYDHVLEHEMSKNHRTISHWWKELRRTKNDGGLSKRPVSEFFQKDICYFSVYIFFCRSFPLEKVEKRYRKNVAETSYCYRRSHFAETAK